MIEALRRVLSARSEVQAALIAAVAVAEIFDFVHLGDDQLSAVNLALVAWFGLASKLAFQRDLSELTSSTTPVGDLPLDSDISSR